MISPLIEVFLVGEVGRRVAIKDSINIAGRVTGMGSRARENVPAAVSNACVVDALLAAGCQIVGKARMHEFAYGVTGISAAFGTPTNPKFPGRVPGGSSSGSAAAVASGVADYAIGSDTGGSIRIPAACCGVFGLKPTFGRVSREGVLPSSTELDCVGPFATSAEGLAKVMAMIDPEFVPVVVTDDVVLGKVSLPCDEAIRIAVDGMLSAADLTVLPVTLESFDAAYKAGLVLIAAEAWSAYGQYAEDPRIGSDIATRLSLASKVTSDQVAEAERVRAVFTLEIDRLLEGMDMLVMPTMPVFPPLIENASDGLVALELTAFVRPFNVSGHPALTIPLNSSVGLPAGLQLIGRKGDDARLCAVAAMIEARAPQHIIR